MLHRPTQRIAAALLSCLLASCSSIGKGVTEAIMQKAEEKPAPGTSFCEITGPEFTGLDAAFKGASEAAPLLSRSLSRRRS